MQLINTPADLDSSVTFLDLCLFEAFILPLLCEVAVKLATSSTSYHIANIIIFNIDEPAAPPAARPRRHLRANKNAEHLQADSAVEVQKDISEVKRHPSPRKSILRRVSHDTPKTPLIPRQLFQREFGTSPEWFINYHVKTKLKKVKKAEKEVTRKAEDRDTDSEFRPRGGKRVVFQEWNTTITVDRYIGLSDEEEEEVECTSRPAPSKLRMVVENVKG
ncbi:hypothetical protein HDV05_006177, partial [Chytridiales sp. JEL 0842]